MADDWDLLAVVRGCTATSTSRNSSTATATATATSCCNSHSSVTRSSSPPTSSFRLDFGSQPLPSPSLEQVSRFFRRDPIGDQLHELYKPFFSRSNPPPIPPPSQNTSTLVSRPVSPPSFSVDRSPIQPPPLFRNQQLLKRPLPSSSAASRSKRRKNQVKKVCQVPAEALSSDVWAWRKYGQKPIKGSPYPRGYYRCSTSKACMARKQVERNRSDPGMFIVTYTAEHNHPAPTHRNSLAGTTRQKGSSSANTPTTPPQSGGESDSSEKPCSDGTNRPSCSSPMTPAEEDDLFLDFTAAESRGEESNFDVIKEEEEEDEANVGGGGGFSSEDGGPSDDFFVGLEELTQLSSLAATGDRFSGTSFGFPRLATAGSV